MTNIPPEQSALLARVTWAIQSHQAVSIPLDLGVYEAYALVAQLQLALRHPGNAGESADCARQFAQALQAYLGREIDPVLAESLEYGWHPEFDVEREEL